MLQKKPTSAAEQEQYVSFGDIARSKLGMQCQYASRYVDGAFPDEYPDLASDPALGNPLRIYGDSGNYHSYMIHRDDVDAIVHRISQYRNAT